LSVSEGHRTATTHVAAGSQAIPGMPDTAVLPRVLHVTTLPGGAGGSSGLVRGRAFRVQRVSHRAIVPTPKRNPLRNSRFRLVRSEQPSVCSRAWPVGELTLSSALSPDPMGREDRANPAREFVHSWASS